MHLWVISTLVPGSALEPLTVARMPNSFGGAYSICYVVEAGHEVRQESKSAVFDLLTLADPSSSIPTHNAEEETERGKKRRRRKKVQYAEDPMFSPEEKTSDVVDESKDDVDILGTTDNIIPNRATLLWIKKMNVKL